MDVASLAGLLHETAEHHDPYEKTHAPHNWWDWYAAYMDAREHGSTPDEAVGGRWSVHGGGPPRRRRCELIAGSLSSESGAVT